MLEPDPAQRKQAMNNPRLKPFWLGAEKDEMEGLWKRCCFRRLSENCRSAAGDQGVRIQISLQDNSSQ
eukprot:2124755-Rhodomonas_salina.1